MQRQIHLLRQLLEDSQYAIDPAMVADAIVARAMARRAVMGTTFRNDVRDEPAQVRSFRPTTKARSFRPCTGINSEDGLLAPWRRR
jgi:aspartate oxidase